MALTQMRSHYGISPTWEVSLAKQVAQSNYAKRFREELFSFTKISVAA